MKMGEIMDCSYGLGSWKLASRFINSSNVYEIDQYEELINWTKENTKENEFFYTFLPDFLGQKLKLATLRPGVGDISDVGLNCKNGKFIASKIRATYSELFSESEKTNNLDEVIEKYSVDYIVADKALCGDSLRKFSKYPQLFSNDKYIVLKVETK
jgi:hypothetical protein